MNHVDMLHIVSGADLPDVALVELSDGLSADIRAEDLVRMFSLVEQATLERAAKAFRENAELCADWMVRTKSMYLDGADALDALKDSHE